MKEEIKDKSDELLALFEKVIIEKVQQILKDVGIPSDKRSAKIIVAKVGKNLMLEIASEESLIT